MTFPAVETVRKIWRLSWHNRLLVFEAVICLAVAGLAIAVLPFRYVGWLAARPTSRHEPPQKIRSMEVKSVRWAILASARQVPWHAVCFQRGLAAQFMLRRRGIPSVLYYGAAPDGRNGLAAHVWVRDGDVDVVGGEIASRFALLATFPPKGGSRPANQ